MPIPNEDQRVLLRAKCRIDLTRLDDALMELPQFILEVAEGTAEAITARDEAANALEETKSLAAAMLRARLVDGKQRSEAQIKTEIPTVDTVLVAQRKLEDAEYDLGRWKALTEAARAHRDALENCGRLIACGYLSPNAIHAQRRVEINRERQRA